MTARNVSGMRGATAGLGLAIAALATGCAADTDGSARGEAPPSAAGSVASAEEAARVQTFLDRQYRREDVVHSFTSKLGDSIDCVAFAAEPGVREMLARGATLHELEELQRPAELPEAVRVSQAAPMNDAYFQGDPDESGRARACPEGSAPHVRITPEVIARAGGLAAYVGAMRHRRSGHGVTPPDNSGAQYAHIEGGWANLPASSVGGMVTLAVGAPVVPASLDHSLAQVWVNAGLNPQLQSVEAGWIVDPGSFTQTTSPLLFIYASADSYAHGCYNNVNTGYGPCLLWMPSGAALAPGATLTASTRGGAQHDIGVSVSHDRTCKSSTCPWLGWRVWISVDGGPAYNLGYYAQSNFNTQGLGSGNTAFLLGSEVYDQNDTFPSPPTVQMGEGPIGAGTYGQAAYVRNYGYFDSTGTLQRAGFITPTPTEPAYVINTTSPAGGTGFGWTNWYYYGDAK